MIRRRQGGFTILEVMIALGAVAAMLGYFVTIAARSVRAANRAKFLTVATELARSKMFDIEEELLKNGFQETADKMEGNFGDEGYRTITWEALIEKIELPEISDMQNAEGDKAMAGADEGAGAAGMTGDTAGGALGASMFMGSFGMIKGVLENAIRKVTLTVRWKIGAEEESFVVVCYFTDPKAVDASGLGGLTQ